jgi:pimeloyl-ACP methyl ester carboxylesterase
MVKKCATGVRPRWRIERKEDAEMGKAGLRLLAAAVLVLALAGGFIGSGCSSGVTDVNNYVVKQNGKAIGSQKVEIQELEDSVVYTGTETRPFAAFDTTFERRLSVTKDLKGMTGYNSTRVVPGASYGTHLDATPDGAGFSYLDNNLQTFDYVPVLPLGKQVVILEPDSACLMQSLIDRFLAANVSSSSAYVVVPSRSPIVRVAAIKRPSQFLIHVSGNGVGDIDVAFGKNSFVTSVRVGDLTVDKGGAGSLTSKPFEPTKKAGSVSDVKVTTPEKLPNGDRLQLAGSLYLPRGGKKPYRAVILTGSSGPQDMTGGGFLSQVADTLAGQGFVVLTCDRRGVPESKGDYAAHTRDTLVSDLNSQVDYLVGRGDIDTERIALVGYGEGGLISASVAGANPYVKRLALMATPSVTMFPDLVSVDIDLAATNGTLGAPEALYSKQNLAFLVQLVSGTAQDTTKIAGQEVFLGWMRSWMEAQPAAELARLKVPVLVMQGAQDDLVPATQAGDIMATLQARPGGQQQLQMFDKLGHDFGPDLSESQSEPYRSHPVIDPGVLDALSTWMKEM